MNPRLLLEQFELHPKKTLGQNFLHDPNALEKIVDIAELMPNDTVLEIGPGTGALTQVLAPMVREVVAVEIDERLRPILRDQLEPYENVQVVFRDILETDLAGLLNGQPYSVVANVPYYITGAILRHVLDSGHLPQRMVLTVQLEVAERLTAKPGHMSLLAVTTQFYGQPKIATRLKPGVFYPRPEVHSAVVRIDIHPQPVVDVPDARTFMRVAKAGFSQKRKQLKNSLSGGLGLQSRDVSLMMEHAGIDPTRRAETLNLEEWAALTRAYAAAQR
jgi:16S rRNA (adenine1518-N6/adenine1519-N6)-dimethyltransferase